MMTLPMFRTRRPVRRLAGRLALASLALVAGGCADAPTFPAALEWLADGEEWVAVLPPAGLPQAADWARFAAEEQAPALARQLASMETSVALALSHGDVAGAARLRADAVLLLGRSIRRAPDAAILRDGAAAIDLWGARVRETVQVDQAPALAAALDTIAATRSRAALALESGDSIGAALALLDAGERIRSWSPMAVAVRLVERAGERVGALPEEGVAATRARHLLLSSRQALRAGDPMRAMQRAIYALQLAGGQQLPDSATGPR